MTTSTGLRGMCAFLRVATISYRISPEIARAEPVPADLPSAPIVAFLPLLILVIVS
jgi:hypothetical protein